MRINGRIWAGAKSYIAHIKNILKRKIVNLIDFAAVICYNYRELNRKRHILRNGSLRYRYGTFAGRVSSGALLGGALFLC